MKLNIESALRPSWLLVALFCTRCASDTPAPEAAPAAEVAGTPAEAPTAAAPDAAPEAAAADGAAPDAVADPSNPPTTAAQTTPATAPPATAQTARAVPDSSAAATPAPTADATSAPTTETAPAAQAPAVAVNFNLVPAKSSLYVQVYKDPDTAAASLSHDHVVEATGWTGKVTWKEGDPSACQVAITVPVSGLRNDTDAMRKRVGYDNTLDDGQRADVKEHMVGKSQLNSGAFPEISFKATRCEAGSGDKVKVTGEMTMHGVSKTISPTLNISGSGDSFKATGTFSLKASDFGFEPFTAMLGALKNRDEMKFTLSVVGQPG